MLHEGRLKQHTHHTDQLPTGSAPLKQTGDEHNPGIILQRQHGHVSPLSSSGTQMQVSPLPMEPKDTDTTGS